MITDSNDKIKDYEKRNNTYIHHIGFAHDIMR